MVLLGYYEHIARSARLTAALMVDEAERLYVIPSASHIRKAEAKLAESVAAEGQVAALEEFGLAQWQATNHN